MIPAYTRGAGVDPSTRGRAYTQAAPTPGARRGRLVVASSSASSALSYTYR